MMIPTAGHPTSATVTIAPTAAETWTMERSPFVAWMIDQVNALVRDVVDGRCRDVTATQGDCGPQMIPSQRRETVLEGASQQHEHPDHHRHAIAQHGEGQREKIAHLGTTTLSGQIAVRTSM